MPSIAMSIFLLLVGGSVSLRAPTLSAQSEDPPAPSVPTDLSNLPLSAARRLEFEDAVSRHEFKRAETILVEESNHDPKSPGAAKFLEIAGSLFFMDRQYLDAAIAWTRAEAIAPLDPRSRFTLAMAYI